LLCSAGAKTPGTECTGVHSVYPNIYRRSRGVTLVVWACAGATMSYREERTPHCALRAYLATFAVKKPGTARPSAAQHLRFVGLGVREILPLPLREHGKVHLLGEEEGRLSYQIEVAGDAIESIGGSLTIGGYAVERGEGRGGVGAKPDLIEAQLEKALRDPTGTPVEIEKLEVFLRGLGLHVARVRVQDAGTDPCGIAHTVLSADLSRQLFR